MQWFEWTNRVLALAALLLCSERVMAQTSMQNDKSKNAEIKLGQFVEFDLAVKEVSVSSKFYEGLGFKNVIAAKADHPVAVLTDGSIVLALHQTEFPSPAITYYGANLTECMRALQADGVKVNILKKENGRLAEVEFADLNGQRVVLKSQAPVSRPNIAFEMMTPAGPQGKEKHYSKLGVFGEFSIATKDRAASATFWQKLGFKKMHESDAPYPWGIYVDGLTVIGLHQSTEFKEPALSFFSKDSKERIVTLKNEGFAFVADIDPTNSVMKSPDGQMIFVFNLP